MLYIVSSVATSKCKCRKFTHNLYIVQVMWRCGVSVTAPEGTRWSSISMPSGCEVRNVSCGATGLVWAVLWNGKALVRIGICGNNSTGDVLLLLN